MTIGDFGNAHGSQPHQIMNCLLLSEATVPAVPPKRSQGRDLVGNGNLEVASAEYDSASLPAPKMAKYRQNALMEERASDADEASPQDLYQIWEWNKTVPASIDRFVHDLVLERTEIQPTAPAICAWDGNLTYAELNCLATGLASHLVDLGVGLNTIIPLCFEKSMWTAVAILAVLKAGAAFVLLDPSLPEHRLRTVSRQTKAKFFISSSANEALSMRLASHVVTLGSHRVEDLYSQPYRQQSTHPNPSSAMYVVFTSGSTGTPKGTIITHRALASALHHQESSLKITVNSRVYDFCSYSFDVSICNIFATLTVGGCVCVPNELDRQDRLAESIASLKANTIDLTPSVSRLLRPEQVPGLQQIIFGGEALHVEDVEPWWEKVRIVSLYGPCECTPNSTINSDPKSPEEATHMGKGVGLNTWIVNAENHDSLVPLRSVGELLLEGPLVGSGYLDDPDKTAAAFIEDPSWLVQGLPEQLGRHGRLYKTGDLVRYNKDGSISFVSRKDEQIKIRGQRVELGEIEHVMCGHGAVRNAVVVLKHEEKQDPWIAGFVTVYDNGATLEEQPNSNDQEVKHTEVWEKQFDDDYLTLDTMQLEEIGRDFMGWTSMYDGSDIDKAEMNEWLDDTIESILNGRQPDNVLEIGTGSGMILFNLIEGLQSYTGLELSGQAVEFVTKVTKSIPAIADKVNMHKATAADISRLGQSLSPDLVVLNSVIQYFPSQAYLLGVVQELVKLKGVKTIFFGDVRSFALYNEFLAARALHITGGKASKDELRRIMVDMRQAESELLIDPAFFTTLPGQIHNIEHVEILPKRMHATNELSAYRYEAVIHVKVQGEPCRQIRELGQAQWIDFQEQGLSRESLLELVRRNLSISSVVAVSNIPHSKALFTRHVVASLDNKGVGTNDLYNWLSFAYESAQNHLSMSAANLVELAEQAGSRVESSWARQFSQRGGLDVIFHRHEPTNGERRVLFRFPNDHLGREHDALCSEPVRHQTRQKIQNDLHEVLKAKLPSYMIPQVVTILDKIPLNHNGKVDRHALANSIQSRTTGREPVQQQISEAEGQIRNIWGEVLGIEPDTIALDDSFFHVGGDSIAAMNFVGRARQAGLELTVAHIFRYPRLQDLVRVVT
jgi:amino acid adenylation domain-containing protein